MQLSLKQTKEQIIKHMQVLAILLHVAGFSFFATDPNCACCELS